MVDILDISDEQLRAIEYKGFEMDDIDRANIEDLKHMLVTNSFREHALITENLAYLEKLVDKMEDAYKIELSVRNNITLLMDIKDVKKMIQQMIALLERF